VKCLRFHFRRKFHVLLIRPTITLWPLKFVMVAAVTSSGVHRCGRKRIVAKARGVSWIDGRGFHVQLTELTSQSEDLVHVE